MNTDGRTRCTICSHSYKNEDLKGVNCCPYCKTKSKPCDPENDISIKINSHELRIIFMWASGYGRREDDKKLDDPNWESLSKTVDIIAERVKKQFPPNLQDMCLTWTDEVKALEKSGLNYSLYLNGKEQT